MEKNKEFDLEKENQNETLNLGISPDYFNSIPAFMLRNDGFVKEWIEQVARGEIKNYSEYFVGDQVLELSNKNIVAQIDSMVGELKKIAQEFANSKDEIERGEILENFKIKV